MNKKCGFVLLMMMALLLCHVSPVKSQIVNQKQRATYYHDKFENRRTSSGERFSQKKYTAAHKTIKFGTLVLVSDSATNRWVIVKVNDRCPRRNIIDLSKKAAKRIDIGRRGGSSVRITELPDELYPLWENQDSIQNTLDNPQFAHLFSAHLKRNHATETSSDDKSQNKNTIKPEPARSERKSDHDKAPELKSETENTADRPAQTPKTKNIDAPAGAPEETPAHDVHSKVDISNIHTLDQANILIRELPDSLLLNSRILQYAGNIKVVIGTTNPSAVANALRKKYPQYTITEK